MKEDLFKKILILVLLLNSFISGNDIITMSKYEYIPIDFVPYNASKTSIGVNFYEDSYSDYEFIAHNWFTDNLYFSGLFRIFNKNIKNN